MNLSIHPAFACERRFIGMPGNLMRLPFLGDTNPFPNWKTSNLHELQGNEEFGS